LVDQFLAGHVLPPMSMIGVWQHDG
jgi:hypothetical protein